MATSKLKHWLIFALGGAFLVFLDLWFKQWAAANVTSRQPVVLIPGILGLTFLENTGAAFGFLASAQQGRIFLTIASALLMAAILWYYNNIPEGKKYWLVRVPVILVFAGGLGNLIDRIALGHVRDMLEFLFIRFPIFNLADVFITTGTFSFVFFGLFVVKDIPLFNGKIDNA